VDELSFIESAGVFSEAPGDLCAYADAAVPINRTAASVAILFMSCLLLRPAPSTLGHGFSSPGNWCRNGKANGCVDKGAGRGAGRAVLGDIYGLIARLNEAHDIR
jgi:hypothetical protein